MLKSISIDIYNENLIYKIQLVTKNNNIFNIYIYILVFLILI